MRLNDKNIYFFDSNFGMRWTLIVFILFMIFIIVIFCKNVNISDLISILKNNWRVFKKNNEKSIEIIKLIKKISIPLIIYISTIAVYYMRYLCIIDNNSLIYKTAKRLLELEDIGIIAIAILLLVGLTYKNKDTYFNYIIRIVSALEVVYITTYYLTDVVALVKWYNYLGIIMLGITFLILSRLKLDFININLEAQGNRYNLSEPANDYNQLFRRSQWIVDDIIDSLKSMTTSVGYSICVAGEWGVGKTSLVNGLITRTIEQKISVEVIRINTMEIEDRNTLINYFFNKIGLIFKKYKIYTGVASEYKKLISSMAGTLINNGIESFIESKIGTGKTDYRENIEIINKVISTHLKDIKIIIVIDDVDRCSNEKAMDFLFTMREIATLNNCISIFLLDYDRFEEVNKLGEGFLDKFFDSKFILSEVKFEEIFEKITERNQHDKINAYDYHQFEEFRKFIVNIIPDLDDNIQKISNSDDLREKREQLKKIRGKLPANLSNPRHILQSVDKYIKLISRIEKNKQEYDDNIQEIIKKHLNKIDYKRKTAILSLIYGLYQYDYQQIQKYGIKAYNSNKNLSSPSIESEIVKYMLSNTYNYLPKTNSYIIDEILTFINWLLIGEKSLSAIANIYTSEDEKIVTDIANGKLPDMNLYNIIQIIHRTCAEDKKISCFIEKTFLLYSQKINIDIENNSSHFEVDTVFEIFENDLQGAGILKHIDSILRLFADRFCKNNCYIRNKRSIKNNFDKFIQDYLFRKLMFISNYFYSVMPLEYPVSMFSDDLSSRLMFEDDKNKSMEIFCDRIYTMLDSEEENKDAQIIIRLKNTIETVNRRYKDENIFDKMDVKMNMDLVNETVKKIETLFEIEDFIVNSVPNEENIKYDFRNLTMQNLPKTIDSLYNDCLSELPKDYFNSDFSHLLNFITNGDNKLSMKYYEKLEEILKNICKINKNGNTLSWRRSLIHIKNNCIETIQEGELQK